MSLLVIITRITGPSKRVINDLSKFFFFLKKGPNSPGTHRICGLNLFTGFCVTSEDRGYALSCLSLPFELQAWGS
jgi:hypothetical protein